VVIRLALAAALASLGGTSPSLTIGQSAKGRPIKVIAAGDPAGTRILVFGCIHGTECAAVPVAERLRAGSPRSGELLAVPNLNPDGYELGTRLNRRGVDLNRNFPSDWTPLGVRGDLQYSGPRPFSEPETRFAARLIRASHPDITIWFHQEAQPMVRAWGPSIPAARRYASLTGLPFYRLPWMNGTAPNWQNHRFPGTTSFVVELAPGPLSHAEVERHKSAIQELSEPQ
jgi:protein MpaA